MPVLATEIIQGHRALTGPACFRSEQVNDGELEQVALLVGQGLERELVGSSGQTAPGAKPDARPAAVGLLVRVD